MDISTSPRSLRQMRWAARAPRLALIATCVVLCAAGLRTVLLPQRPVTIATRTQSSALMLAPAAFAESFARAYLTWDPRKPEQRDLALEQFAPALADSGAPGPPRTEQQVAWSAVASDRPVRGGHRITVLADTTNGRVALVVTVAQDDRGSLAVREFPALVGWPATATAPDAPPPDAVDNDELDATVSRALRNFLAGRRDALAADLLPGAVIALPDQTLRMVAVEDLSWTSRRRGVAVVVRARLSDGGELRLGYELGVAREAGRWFVRWIGTDQTQDGRTS
ncbi:MAG: conjugal transfer protein [Solirubrobacteraceae bacterium]